MTTEQKQLITATVPVLKESGLVLSTHFYKRMFERNPELKNMFNMGNQQSGKQQTALAMAVLAYAENIADPSVLLPVVDRIGHKHASLDIRPEHYKIVGDHLIASIKEVPADAATPAVVDAWTAAYQQLAQLMSGHEANLYEQRATTQNGWSGWRPFKVGKKAAESTEVTSFYLYPVDGGKVPAHAPGQYVSIRLFLPTLNLNQARQYSISSVPNQDFYRISVKRESGVQLDNNGLISNRLHDFIEENDIVELTSPAGNFMLAKNVDAPIMFISGGVGLTPFISVLQQLVEKKYQPPITWLHGCRNSEVHAFKEQVDSIAAEHQNFTQYIFYNTATETNKRQGVLEGIVDLNKIAMLEHHPQTQYFICGPAVFIQKQFKNLVEKGIERSAIFFEEFGPQLLQLS